MDVELREVTFREANRGRVTRARTDEVGKIIGKRQMDKVQMTYINKEVHMEVQNEIEYLNKCVLYGFHVPIC